jgi:hypothetical protein
MQSSTSLDIVRERSCRAWFVSPNGRPFVVMGFTVARGKIVEIDCFLDPEPVEEEAKDFDGRREPMFGGNP